MHEKIAAQLLPPTLVALDELATELKVSLADLMTEIALMDGPECLEEKAQSLLVAHYREHKNSLSDASVDWQGPTSPLLKNALDSVRKMNRKT